MTTLSLPQALALPKGQLRPWTPLKGWEDTYEIRSDGYVRRLGSFKPLSFTPCGAGYFTVRLTKMPKRARPYVHRLVLEQFGPSNPGDYEIDHQNGVKTDNRIENLRWVTHKENCMNRYNAKGEDSGMAKLTWRAVEEIRKNTGVPLIEFARKFGVSRQTITFVKQGHTWRAH